MTNNNVIPFPHQRNVGAAPNFEQVQESLELHRINQIMEVTGALTDAVVQIMVQLGYDFPVGTKAEKDFFLVIESIRSMISKYHDEHHAFHELAEHSFEILDEEGSYFFLSPTMKNSVQFEKENDPDDSIGC